MKAWRQIPRILAWNRNVGPVVVEWKWMAPIDIGLTIKYYATLIFWDTLYNVVISVLFVKKAVGGVVSPQTRERRWRCKLPQCGPIEAKPDHPDLLGHYCSGNKYKPMVYYRSRPPPRDQWGVVLNQWGVVVNHVKSPKFLANRTLVDIFLLRLIDWCTIFSNPVIGRCQSLDWRIRPGLSFCPHKKHILGRE